MPFFISLCLYFCISKGDVDSGGDEEVNIIEAINSGKRFRRKVWDKDKQQLSWNEVYGTQPLEIAYGDAVADDWEVEETTVTITRTQFDEAWDRTRGRPAAGLAQNRPALPEPWRRRRRSPGCS